MDIQTIGMAELMTRLISLPKEIEAKEKEAPELRAKLEQAKEQLELCEANAALGVNADGKTAEIRKVQMTKGIHENTERRNANENVFVAQAALQGKEIEAESLRRQFAGLCKIAELRAAQMNLQAAKGDR